VPGFSPDRDHQNLGITKELNKARMCQKRKEMVAGRGDSQKFMYLKLKELIHVSVDVSQKRGNKKGGIVLDFDENKRDKSLTFIKFPARPECL